MVGKTRQKKSKKERTSKKEQTLVVAQEIKFARLLCGNEKKHRDRVLKALKKWLKNCFEKNYEFKEDDFLRVWKGLFYAVWMSDKPLVQEELCENITCVLDEFPASSVESAALFTRAGLKVLATEWYGIDQHRMDKFLMLVRRLLRAWLRCLKRCEWSVDSCCVNTKMLSEEEGLLAVTTPAYARNALSLQLHITECYLEEISKVSAGRVRAAALAELARPFARLLAGGARLAAAARRHVFTALVRQSAAGLAYEERRLAWEQMGCPEGGPDALEPVSDDEETDDADDSEVEECESKPLDPRAGRVNVTLTPLPVPAEELATMLRTLARTATSSAHTRLKICAERFEKLSKNEYPLPVAAESLDVANPALKTPSSRKAAAKLKKLERKLIAESDELAIRGLNRKHKKRVMAKAREQLNDNVERGGGDKLKTANGEWQVEDTQPPQKKRKANTQNKENDAQPRKAKQHKPNGDVQKEKKPKRDTVITKNEKIDEVNVGAKLKTSPKKEKAKEEKSNTERQQKESVKPEPETESPKSPKRSKILTSKVKNYQKVTNGRMERRAERELELNMVTPKKVKFVLKNNIMQGTMDYYKSVRLSPNIPYDSTKRPSKTNLKANSTPSPINPFLKKKLRSTRN